MNKSRFQQDKTDFQSPEKKIFVAQIGVKILLEFTLKVKRTKTNATRTFSERSHDLITSSVPIIFLFAKVNFK